MLCFLDTELPHGAQEVFHISPAGGLWPRNVQYVRKYFCVARHGDDVLGAYCAPRSVCRVTITVTSVGIENFPR